MKHLRGLIMVVNIWKSYMCSAVEDTNIELTSHLWTGSWKIAWKKFRSVRDLNPWPLRYRCSALPTEPSSQLGAGHYVGSKWTSQVVNNGCKYMKIIARVLALYKSYWAAMNKVFIYARTCVNKMTWAFYLPGFRVSVLLNCSAVFFLFEIWKKPAKNWPIFLFALTF